MLRRKPAEDRKTQIVAALLDLADRIGPDRLTTNDVAREVGVTQAAIFRHFPTKETIWIAVVHWVRARLLSVIDRAASQATDPLDAIRRIFFAHVAFAQKNPALPRLLLTTSPQLKRLTQEFLDGYETKLAGLLADARALGLVRSDLDGEVAATLFIGIIQGLAIRFLSLGPRNSLSDEAKRLFPIFLAGIGASEP